MVDRSPGAQHRKKTWLERRALLSILITCMITLVSGAWATRATAQVSVNGQVSVDVGLPSFYGILEIGALPPPPVVFSRPTVIVQTQEVLPPLYLRVPPGHYKHWSKHCYRYNACNRQVYFVEERWYRDVYVVHHRHHDVERVETYERHAPRGRAYERVYEERVYEDHGHGGHGYKGHGDKGHGKGHKKD